MSFALLLVIGGLIGWVAALLPSHPRRVPVSLTAIMGMSGSILGVLLSNMIFGTTVMLTEGLSFENIVCAVAGASLTVALVMKIDMHTHA